MSATSHTIDALIDDLCGSDEVQRTHAAFALGVLGDAAVGPLINLLSASTSEVRKRATWVLGVIGAPALPALIALAEGPDEKLRIEAIRVLGVVGEARALNQLFLGLTDPTSRVAARSARALGKLGDPRAYHPLVTALRHPDPDVRYEVCRALVELGISDAASTLRVTSATDQTRTSWGASVADAAMRAAAELDAAARSPVIDDQFARIREFLREQPDEEGAA